MPKIAPKTDEFENSKIAKSTTKFAEPVKISGTNTQIKIGV